MNNNNLHTVLMIEDDPGDSLLIKEMLEQQECKARIVNVERLSEGICFLQQNHCDVVLLDMNLPDSSGLSTMTRLLDAAPTTPIVVLTGLSDESFGIESLKSGAQDYLVKGDIDGRVLKRSIFYAVERKKLEIALKQTRDLFERQARIDYLTGIYNRLMFTELLEAELQRARRYGSELSLIMFDLDHFKNINDTHGHNMGDHVLKEIAKLVSDTIRAHDIISRWGGEEFMLLAPKTDFHQAAILAEKLRVLFETHDFSDGLQVTASFGVTQFRGDDHADSFTARADEAMYMAKQNGRNRIETM
ncbi:MAG: diguanylate cyclase [Geobacteraceae bacterium]|nr:diguanylate cyclase [Geobacteraceae bacterium]NTW80826.1 diguanylate cyclase [Geobacteraceae bacterium]